MSHARPTILVIGGGSRIATALVPLLHGARWVSRQSTGRAEEVCVPDYHAIPSRAFDGIECVINCVGTTDGGQAELDRINVSLALQFANQAKMAGANRFIHISSFSVYGHAQRIDRGTYPSPTTDYGRSKLAADTALGALEDSHFEVTLLRLPLIYGIGSLGKLGQLLKIWRRVRVMPAPTGDIARAMIGVALSAEVIARLAGEPRAGIVFAADPEVFTYRDAARARPHDLPHTIPLPRGATRLFTLAAPAIGARLFADSRLADGDNLAIEYGLASRLYHDIASAHLG